jgi:hypothetical protein
MVVGAMYLALGDKHVTPLLLGGLALAHVTTGVALSVQKSPWAHSPA